MEIHLRYCENHSRWEWRFRPETPTDPKWQAVDVLNLRKAVDDWANGMKESFCSDK